MAKNLKNKSDRDKYLKIDPKVWGKEKWIVNRDYCGKILVLKKGFRCSYHCHQVKDETFYINKGKILLEYGDENLKGAKKIILTEGESKHITPGLYHRFNGLVDSEIIEFSTNHREKDSFRKTPSSQALPASIFQKIINNFKNAGVLVIGDIILDQYVLTDPEKISPEAPILTVLAQEIKNVLGGAANVCNNLRSLDVNCGLIGIVGQDEDSKIIKGLLEKNKIPLDGIFSDKRITTKKIRVIAKNQQLLRLDYEKRQDIKKGLEAKIFQLFSEVATNFNVVILSDYAKGVLTHDLIRKIVAYCKRKKITIIVDPRPAHINSYPGTSIITPNLAEAMAMSGISDKNKIKNIGKNLQKKLNCNVVLTLGADGMMIFEKNKINKIKNSPREVYDISGAGDTVVATIAACLSSGSNLLNAGKLANIAAGMVVGKFGTATVSNQELRDYIYDDLHS